MSQQHQQQQQYFSKQRLLQQQQQQQQQRAWHYEHANNDNINMFAGTGIRGGSISEGNRNVPGRSNIGYDLEMGGGNSVYYGGGYAPNQLQRQQQQQHAMQIARRHQQQIAQQQHQQQQQYSQNYQQHEQQQRLLQQQQQQLQNQLFSHIKSEPNDDDAIEQMLTPTIEMEELIIKSEPPEEQAYNSFLRHQHQQQQQQHQHHSLPNMPFKHSIPPTSTAAIPKPPLSATSQTPQATTSTSDAPSINSDMQQFYPQVTIKEEFPRPAEPQHQQNQQQKPPNFPRLKVQTERSGTLPICQRCKQVFLKKHSYVQHVSQSTCDIVEYDLKCEVCSMSFMSSEELTAHEKLHRQNKFFCHKYCGKYFDSIEACELHEFQHHEYATYVCNICSATFPNRELLFSHMPQHRQQPRFDCPVCRLWFQTPLELHQHRLASPYFCGKFYDGHAHNADFRSPGMQSSPQLATQRPHFNSPDARALNPNASHIAQGIPKRYFPPLPRSSHLPPTATPSTPTNSNRIFPPDRFVLNPMANRNLPMLPHATSSMQRMKQEIKMEPDLLYAANEYSPRIMPHTSNQQQQRFPNDFNDDSFSSGSSISALHSFSSDFGNFGTHPNSQIARPEVVDDSEDSVCCVQKCGTRKSACPSLQYFRFPRDQKYLHQWLHNLKMLHLTPDLNLDDLRICSLHFPKRCINRYSLCYWAVPTFNLGHDEVANIYQNREITNTFTIGENARCSMPGCNSQRGESNMKFYNFPKEVKMLIKWCQNARLPVHTKEPRHFCSRHFEDRCYGKFRLKPWAVPTLHLGTPYGRIHDNPSVLILEEKKCCLPHCKRARSSDFNLSLYRFPRDETLLRRWCYNLRLDPDVYRGKNHKICSNHFIKEVLGLRKLSPGAVPTLNLGHNDTFNFYENELNVAPALPPPVASTPKVYTFHHSNPISANSSMSSSVSHYASASLSSSPTNFSPISTPVNQSASNLMDFADYCLVPGCTSTRTTEGVTLHTIPRRHEQMLKWCHNLKMEPSQIHKGLRICNLHFEPYCIGGCMRPFAVPTLNLGHDDPNIHKNPDVIKKLNIRETCCVQICKRNRDRDRANLHRFPSKIEMLTKWCVNLKKPLPDGTRLFNDAICEMHFEERCLKNKRIEKWAVPTLNLGHNDIVHHLPTEEEVAEMWARQNLPTANTGDEEGTCSVETCKRNPEVDDIRLYRVPDNPEILSKWAHNLQIDMSELSTLRICNLHFEPRCIGKKLHSWAIPTMNLAKQVEPLYENPSHNLMLYRKEKSSVQRSFEIEKPVDEFGEPLQKPIWAPRCCLPHCRNKRGVNNVQLFRIPYNNRSMMAKWCHNLQIPLTQLKPRRVCSTHFEPHVLTKRCPMPQAVPTLDLNTPPGYKIYQNPSRLKSVKLSAQTICSVESCRKTRSDGVQLFRLPLKGAQLRKWAHNLRLWENNKLPNLTTRAQMRVCSRHFEPHSFGAKRLVPSAIPTLNVGHDQLDDLFPNEAQPFSEIQCVVTGCNSIKDADNYVRLFKFPAEDEDLLWKWCNNLKMNPIDCTGVRICQRHFESDCMGPKNLYKWAIPTLELGHNDTDIELIPNPKPEDRYTETIAKCLVPDCGKTRKYDEVQLNSFPKNPRAFRRWKHNLKLDYLDFKRREQYRICNEHFLPICQGKNRLKHGAIPTLKLGHDDTSDLYEVRAEDMHYVLFGKPVPAKTNNQLNETHEEAEEDADIDNNEDIEMANDGDNDSMLPPYNLEVEHKCCYPDCTASKTVLREIYELPKADVTLETWCKAMKTERDSLNAVQSKLCGLHYIKLYESTKDTIDKSSDELEADFNKLTLAYYRACNSLTIRSARCSVPDCFVSQLYSEYRLYSFPYNKELIEKWTHNTRVELDEHRRYLNKICGRHFESYCLTDTQKLRPWAIPTLHLSREDELESRELHQNPDLNSVERRMLGRITYKCCVPCCGLERTDDNNVRLFNFPTDEAVLEKWAHNLQLPRQKCPLYKICDAHFEAHCMGQSRLRSWAIPTLNLGYDEQKIDFELHQNPVKSSEKWNDSKDTSALTDEVEIAESEDGSTSSGQPMANVKIKKSIHVVKCCVPRCRKSRLKHGINLFSFPNSTVLFKKWCHNLQLTAASINKHTRVCNTHFHRRCFDDAKQLRPWALPTLHLGHDESLYQNPKVAKTAAPTSTTPSQQCAITSCVNHKSSNVHVTFVSFPDDKQMLQKWCAQLKINLNAQQAKQKRLCLTEHFESESIAADGVTLKSTAVPTLNLGNGETLVEEASDVKTENSSANVKVSSHDAPKFESPERKSRSVYSNAPICCLKHCRKEKTAEQHLTTFGFPKDPQILEKWCDNLQLKPEECFGRVCIEHFELRVLGNRRLKPGAVPTLNLEHTNPLKHTNGKKLTCETLAQPASSKVTQLASKINTTTNVDINSESIKNSAKQKLSRTEENSTAKAEADKQTNVADTTVAGDEDFYSKKLNHSVFRLCCLKHCRRRTREREKQTEAPDSHGGGSGNGEQHPLRLFKFPREPKIVRRWAHNLRLPLKYVKAEKRKLRICDAHFDAAAYEGANLKPKAVPTLDLGYDTKQVGLKLFENRAAIKVEKPKFCCIKSCKANTIGDTTNSEHKLFAFPKRGQLLRKWAHNIQQVAYTCQQNDYHICAQHFESKCFDDKNELKAGMVPTLKLNINEQAFTMYTNDDTESELPPPPVSLNITINDNKSLKQQQQQQEQAEKQTQIVCCIPNCGGLKGQYIVHHFPFPSDEAVRKKWFHNLRINENGLQIEKAYVCSLHFKMGCIKKKILNNLAIPTENLGFDSDSETTTPMTSVFQLYENPAEIFENPNPSVIPRCCVRTCNKTHRHDGVRLFHFPKNRIYYLKWAHNLGVSSSLKAIQSYRVCELHFDENCMRNKRLLSGAIPTLALGSTAETSEDTEVQLFESDTTKLTREMKTFRKRNNKISKGSIKCAIKGCCMLRSSAIALVSLPREPDTLRQQWLAYIDSTDSDPQSTTTGCPKLCALHFIQAYRRICSSSNDADDSTLKKENDCEITSELNSLRLRYEQLLRSAYVKQLMCSVPGCDVTYTDNIIFHQFPKEPSLFEKWQHNTQITADSQKRYIHKVCSLHFEERCFGAKRLRGWAIPTINLPKKNEGCELFANPPSEEDMVAKINVSTEEKIKEKIEYCCVPQCQTNNTEIVYNETIEFWTLPVNEPEMLTKWLHNIGLQETDTKKLRKQRICNRHFASTCFSEKHRLRNWALPTLELPTPTASLHQNPDDIVNYKMCCIPTCNQKRDRYAGIHLYTFPQHNKSLFEKWVHNVRLDAELCRKSGARICTLHFPKHMIRNRNLVKGAVPTLDLGHNETEIFVNPKKLKKGKKRIKQEKSEKNEKGQSDEEQKQEEQEENIDCKSGESGEECVIKNVSKSTAQSNECCMTACKIKTKFSVPTFDLFDAATTNGDSFEQASAAVDKPRLFAFPKIDWLVQKWCENTGQLIERARKLWICEKHFETHAIGRSKPRPLAVPTVLLGNGENSAPPIHENPKQLKRYHPEEKECGEVRYVRGNCCAIISCFESGVRLYKYPTKGMLLQKWAQNCRHHAYQAARYNFRICGKHFAEECFQPNGRLRFGAVPTLYLGFEDESNKEEIVPLHTSEFVLQKRKKKFKKKTVTPKATAEISNVIKKCGVPNCGRTKKDDGVHLYKFPTDSELLEQWCHNLQLKPSDCSKLVICNMHFEARCINQRGVFKRAVPTLLLGHSNIRGETLIENPEDVKQPYKYHHCCVNGCQSSRLQTDNEASDIVLSAFPKCRTLFEKWAHNINLEPTNELWHNIYKKVCNLHFEPFCYEHRRLKSGAIPTLNLGHSNLDNIYTVTEEELNAAKHLKPTKKTSIRSEQVKNELQGRQLYCVYPLCQEYEKHKFVHAFEVPKTPVTLHNAWRDTLYTAHKLTTRNEDEPNFGHDKLQLCPVHFKMIFELHKPLGDKLTATTTEEHDNLAYLREANLKVSQMARIRALLCGVPSCSSNVFHSVTADTASTRLYSLPVNCDQALKWYHNANVPAEEEMRASFKICELHFETECFAEHSKRLRGWALPTLNLPAISGREIYANPVINSAERNAQKVPVFKCCVKSCVNAETTPAGETTTAAPLLFSFPRDELVLKKWLHNTGLRKRDIFQARICQLHFEVHCFNKRLSSWAIPTLKLDVVDENSLYRNPRVKKSIINSIIKRKNEEDNKARSENVENSAVDENNETSFGETVTSEPKRMSARKQKPCSISMLETSATEAHTKSASLEKQKIKKSKKVRKVELEMEMESENENESENVYKSENSQPQASEHSISNIDDEENISVNTNVTTTPIINDNDDSDDIPLIAKRLKLIPRNDTFEVDHNLNINMMDVEKTKLQSFETNECNNENFLRNTTSNSGEIPESFITIKDEPIEIEEYDDNENAGNEVNFFNANQMFVDTHSIEAAPARKTLTTPIITPPAHSTGLMIVKAESLQGSIRQKEFAATMHLTEQEKHDPNGGDVFCCIRECINAQTNRKPFAILYKFPQQPTLFAKWRHNCQLNPRTEPGQRALRVCERHFESKCYRNGKLMEGVVPTLELGRNSSVQMYENHELFARQRGVGQQISGDNDHFKHTSAQKYAPKCCLAHCQQQQNELGNVHFFKFPESLNVLDKWLHNLPISYDNKQPWKYLICSQHFEKCCFKQTEQNQPPALHAWATPTLNLGDHAPFILFTNQDVSEAQQLEQDNYNIDDDMETAAFETENSLLNPIYERALPANAAMTKSITPTIGATSRTPTSVMATPGTQAYEYAGNSGSSTGCQYISTSYKRCCVPHCKSPRTDTIKLFHFPANYEDARQWQNILNMQLNERELRVKLVCSQHFAPQFVGQRRLCGRSVMPTLNLGATAPTKPLIFCSVPNCRNTSHKLKVFTSFPHDPELLKKWCKNLRIDPRNYVRGRYNICRAHFAADSFADDSDEQLKREAVPTLNLPKSQISSGFEPIIARPMEQQQQKAAVEHQPNIAEHRQKKYQPIKRTINTPTQNACCAPDCGSPTANFVFPRNPTLRAKWCHNLRIHEESSAIDSLKVCRRHFPPHCIRNDRLHPEAVPTLYLGLGIAQIYQNSAACEQLTTAPRAVPESTATLGSSDNAQYFRPIQTMTQQNASKNFPNFKISSTATYIDLDYDEINNTEVDIDNRLSNETDDNYNYTLESDDIHNFTAGDYDDDESSHIYQNTDNNDNFESSLYEDQEMYGSGEINQTWGTDL